MSRVLLLACALYAPVAFACPDEGGSGAHAKGEKSGCPLPDAAATAALPADGTHITLAVAGMHCGGCVNTVHTALMGVDGVKGAQVDLAGGKVEVAYDAAKTNTDKLIAAVAATGKYTASVPKKN